MSILILPCAGKGSKLGLPYPKEFHAIDYNTLLIDHSLTQGANAGITDAIIVVTQEKLSLFKSCLGNKRKGVKLHYIVIEVLNSLPTTSLLGCRYAFYELNYTDFIIALPDTILEDKNAIKNLISDPFIPKFGVFSQPAEKFDAIYVRSNNVVGNVAVKKPLNESLGKFVGTWGLIHLGIDDVNRLYEILIQSPKKTKGDIFLFGEIINEDCKINNWGYLKIPGNYLDLGTWGEIYSYIIKNNLSTE